MKLHTKATIFTVILWVFWLVPLLGKKIAPDFFGNSLVQWVSAVVVAMCVPVAVLMALKLLSGQNRRRAGFGIAFVASLPLFCNLVMYGVIGTMLARTNMMLLQGHEREFELIATLTDRSLSEESAETRAKSAGTLYDVFGVQSVWKNAEEELERYYPTVEQQEMWEQTAQLKVSIAETMDWQLKQMPWLFGLNLGSFSVIVFGGLAWRAYKPNSEGSGG